MSAPEGDLPRFTLEPISPQHAGEMFEVLSDPGVHEYTEERPPVSLGALRDRYARLAGRRSPDGSQIWLNWIIRDTATGRCAGYVQATVEADRPAWFAYLLGPGFQGRGLATAACREAIGLLRRDCGVRELLASVDPRNAKSIRLLERLGFREVTAGQYTAGEPAVTDRVFRLGGNS